MKKSILLFFVLFVSKVCFGQQYANSFDGGTVPTGTWTIMGTQITTGTTVNSNNSIPTGGSSSGANHLLFSDCGSTAGTSSVIVSGINMSTRTNIKIGFDIRKTGAFNVATPIEFSINGGVTWLNLGDLNTIGPNNSTWSFNSISLPSSADNQADIRFRITFPNVIRNCVAPPNLRIDDFIVFYGSNSFPIKLTQFTANIVNEKQTELKWETSSEIGFSHFEVQRSFDALGFESIGRQNGKVDITEKNEYSFIDVSPNIGPNYYRLKQVDIDGTEEYSKIVSVNIFEEPGVLFYPNPTQDILSLKSLEKDNIKSVKVLNNAGNEIGNLKPLDNKIDLHDFPAQILWIEATLKDGTIYKKRIVKY